jgi:TPR repeat protein
VALAGLGCAILLAGALFAYNWPSAQNAPAVSKSAAVTTAQPEMPPGAAESQLSPRHEGASDVPSSQQAVAPSGNAPTDTAKAPSQAQRRPADPTRLALPIPVLSVANELKLSTEVAELIFLQDAVGLIEAKRYSETLPDLRSLAEAGQPIAQFWLAYLYYKGFGVPTEMETALRWFKLAAEQGLPFAQQFAGTMLMESKRSASEQGLGTLWLNLAAKQGYQPAADTLKRFKLKPNPNTPSLDSALKAFDANDGAKVVSEARVFVDNNSGFAAYLSGRVLFEGRGMAADPVAGIALLRQAARQQVGDAMELLARAYGEGKGVDRNTIEAVAWARLAVRNTLDKTHAATLLPTAVRMRAAVRPSDLATLDKVLPPVSGETASP